MMLMSQIQKLAEDYFEKGKTEVVNDIYDYFMKKIEWQVWNKGDFADVKSNMNLAVAQSLSTYDITKKIQLSTYVWTCFKNLAGTQKIRRNAGKRGKGQEVVYLNRKIKVGEGEKEFHETLEDKSTKKMIDQKISNIDFYSMLEKIIDKKDRFILEKTWEGWTQSEIGKELNITNAAICTRLKRLAQGRHAELIYKTLRGE
jgi:RNA polymerase sigma factor (sigma-70 family)